MASVFQQSIRECVLGHNKGPSTQLGSSGLANMRTHLHAKGVIFLHITSIIIAIICISSRLDVRIVVICIQNGEVGRRSPRTPFETHSNGRCELTHLKLSSCDRVTWRVCEQGLCFQFPSEVLEVDLKRGCSEKVSANLFLKRIIK